LSPGGLGGLSAPGRLYRLALEKHQPGAPYHAAAEEGVRLRDIAEAIGRGLKIPAVSISPEEAPAHFGWMSIDYFADCSQLNERLMSGGLKKVSTRA